MDTPPTPPQPSRSPSPPPTYHLSSTIDIESGPKLPICPHSNCSHPDCLFSGLNHHDRICHLLIFALCLTGIIFSVTLRYFDLVGDRVFGLPAMLVISWLHMMVYKGLVVRFTQPDMEPFSHYIDGAVFLLELNFIFILLSR